MTDQTHELLDAPPPAIARPLALIDGRAYAATWLYVRSADSSAPDRPPVDAADPPEPSPDPGPGGQPRPETLDHPPGSGRPADRPSSAPPRSNRPSPPRVTRQLFVARDDGRLFGPGADAPIDALGLAADLDQALDDCQLWRRQAVERYRQGERPDPADLLARLAAVYDAFVDFDRSLADQSTMCQLCACSSLATWLLDAFPLAPYLWFTGERGSGKTQLGTIWARTSYLGEVVLAAGTFSALRDLAARGASLYFDDAEAFGDGRRGDRDKRDLLLAGNRRGAHVPLKTFVDGRWQTRRVPAFTARAFSAIALPDPTLASRAVVVPLSRTLDPARAARDVGDPAAWPCDERALVDDLWAFGLALLPRAAASWREFEADRQVVGREFEKWRPLLAVARLLADHGRPDLEPRLRALMACYQAERPVLAADDETLDVVHGLVAVGEQIAREWAQHGRRRTELWQSEVDVPNALITARVAREAGRPWDTRSRSHSTRVGHVMARLRFRAVRQTSRDRGRGWRLSVQQIAAVARAYGVEASLDRFADTSDTSDTSDTFPGVSARTHPSVRQP